MTFARRLTVLLALGLWQGGFPFYAAFVVPVGQEIHAGPIDPTRGEP